MRRLLLFVAAALLMSVLPAAVHSPHPVRHHASAVVTRSDEAPTFIAVSPDPLDDQEQAPAPATGDNPVLYAVEPAPGTAVTRAPPAGLVSRADLQVWRV